jgi:hypothetical protein
VLSENLDFIAFVIVAFSIPVVIGVLSSTPQRAVLWVFLVLGGGLIFESIRDWWRGREDALLSLPVAELLYVLVLAFAVLGGLAVIGHRLKQSVRRRRSSP